jgi:hypothetical protein
MDAPDPPKAPDPQVVAEAQTKSNKETAVANAYLNRIDQTSPFGTNTYQVTGTNPDGTPKFSQSTQFSQPVQGLFDNYMSMTQGMGDIGNMQLAGLQQQYAQPLNLNTETENRIAALRSARLDPELARQDEALRTRLTNQGFREGTEGWDRALERQGRMATDSRNQLWLDARQQGMQEAIAQRQLPLNEFNALRTGSQVSMPQFTGVPGVQQANTDVAGITQQGFANEMGLYNAQNTQNNAFMGGLFQMGAAAIPLMRFSDIRLKRDVVRVGELPSSLPEYEWTYIWGGPRYRGVMAHEAREVFPDAVVSIGGYLAVDYSKVG